MIVNFLQPVSKTPLSTSNSAPAEKQIFTVSVVGKSDTFSKETLQKKILTELSDL